MLLLPPDRDSGHKAWEQFTSSWTHEIYCATAQCKMWAPQSGRTWSYGCPLNSFSFHHHKREYKMLLPFIFHWLHKLFSWQDSATAFHLAGWTDWAFLVDSIKIDVHSNRTNSSGRELLQWVILRQSLYTSFSNSLNSLNDKSAQKQ